MDTSNENGLKERFQRTLHQPDNILFIPAVTLSDFQMNLWTMPIWDPSQIFDQGICLYQQIGLFMLMIKDYGSLLSKYWLAKRHVVLICPYCECCHQSQFGQHFLLKTCIAFWKLDIASKTFKDQLNHNSNHEQKQPLKQRAVPVSWPISTLNCDRISPSLLSLLWLDLCCLDTVHTAVRLGHSQAREESGVNGTRKTLFPKMYLFLDNLKLKGFFLLC